MVQRQSDTEIPDAGVPGAEGAGAVRGASGAPAAASAATSVDAPHPGNSGGQDSDEVFKVETHGIDPIPDDERHGSAKDLFWLWFGSNLTFTYVINGASKYVQGMVTLADSRS